MLVCCVNVLTLLLHDGTQDVRRKMNRKNCIVCDLPLSNLEGCSVCMPEESKDNRLSASLKGHLIFAMSRNSPMVEKINCRVDVDNVIWVLVKYESQQESSWRKFNTVTEMNRFVQATNLQCPQRCLTPDLSNKMVCLAVLTES